MVTDLQPGEEVTVFTTPDSNRELGSGIVKRTRDDGTIEVSLSWNLADGKPAVLYTQPACLRVRSSVTESGRGVAVVDEKRGIFVRGKVAGVSSNPSMVQVNLDWNLADGLPARLYTPANNLTNLDEAEALHSQLVNKKKRAAIASHAAKFKNRTKVVVLAQDGSGATFAMGTVTKNRFASKSCVVNLLWRLADGKAPRLFVV